MTFREYAKMHDFEVVGKITRKVSKVEKFNWAKGEMETISTIYWVDEAGNSYANDCICTADGEVI